MPLLPVEVLPIAQDDVDQALIYVSVEDPYAAKKLLEGILAALDQASRFPYSGTEIMVGGRRPRKYYRLYVHPYSIYYRVIRDTVVVMRVLHERMDRAYHLP